MSVSYQALFIIDGSLYLIIAVLGQLLPKLEHETKQDTEEKGYIFKNKSVIFLFICIMLTGISFTGYNTTMPLYVINQMGLSEKLPGYLLAIAAFLEMPLMMCTAYFAKKINLKLIISVGIVGLIVFHIIYGHITTPYQFMVLQFLPALYIASVHAMGMVYFQELLPKIPGQATSLFLNAFMMGQILGGLLLSIARDGDFSPVFTASAVIALIGLVFLIAVKKTEQIR